MPAKKTIYIPIEISARHIHISKEDLEILFGKGHKLKPLKALSQTGQYASTDVVEIQTFGSWGRPAHERFTFGKAPDKNEVRVLGPARTKTQLEISYTDAIYLGLKPQVRISGDHKGTNQKAIIIGPEGEVKLTTGIIVAKRHIHAGPKDAKKYGLKNGMGVSVKTQGTRSLIFENVEVRVHESFIWSMHIDIDEANAAGLSIGSKGEVLLGVMN